ncbi:MAG: hypothetical protein J0L92_22850 [Deltaproteobacteria bacterium]|nr:hypothetical protein [Deltaproteobacteria bacterium]
MQRSAIALLFSLALSPASPVAYAQNVDTRVTTAHRAYDLARAASASGMATTEEVYVWSVRWLDAERLAAPDRAQAAVMAHLSRMTTLEAEVRARVATGSAPASAEAACAYYVAEARAWQTQPPRL